MNEENHKLRCRLKWHNWNKWEDINTEFEGREHIYIKQIRVCRDCGKKRGRSKCEVSSF